MGDAQQIDLSYGTYMVLRKPLFFWLRWGGFALAVIEVLSETQTRPGAYGRLGFLFWARIALSLVYGILF